MLTYGLQRHRPLLLVAGFAALASAMARVAFYHSIKEDPGALFSYSFPLERTFRVGQAIGLFGYALLLVGLILLAASAGTARLLLIVSAIVWIPAQALMVISHANWYGPEWSIARISVIAYFVFDSSLFPILILTMLLMAGIGSTRRPKAEPHDEHLLRERAAGGYSGFVFAVSIGTAILWALQHASDPAAFRRLLTPTGVLGWSMFATAAIALIAVGVGIAGWVLMLARRRLAGIALVAFTALFAIQYLAGMVQSWALEREYGSALSFPRNWPPLGTFPMAADSIEILGITILGIVWGWRYFRAPPRVEAGSAFQPMMRRTPPPLPGVLGESTV